MDGLPWLVSTFGVVLSALLGMAINKLGGIQAHLEQLNGKVFNHMTTANVHEAGFARVEEQIKNLANTISVAHDRIDAMKGHG